jgi:two-component system response regulator AtoC
VGSQVEKSADIRVIAATWRDLSARMREGAFREDLYHRLTIVELITPPLRERPEDIEELLLLFMDAEAASLGRSRPRLEASVRAHLRRWPWPGNVRELKNVASYITAMTAGNRVGLADLPRNLHRASPDLPPATSEMAFANTEIRIDLPYMEARRIWLDDFQQRYVETILEAHKGNVSAAARAAGMDRRSIQRILGRHTHREARSDRSPGDV